MREMVRKRNRVEKNEDSAKKNPFNFFLSSDEKEIKKFKFCFTSFVQNIKHSELVKSDFHKD